MSSDELQRPDRHDVFPLVGQHGDAILSDISGRVLRVKSFRIRINRSDTEFAKLHRKLRQTEFHYLKLANGNDVRRNMERLPFRLSGTRVTSDSEAHFL